MQVSLDKRLADTLCAKPDVLQVEKVIESEEKEYWCIVEDSLSDSVLEYNNVYFDILKETGEYFEFKVLELDDLEYLEHIRRNTIYKKVP